VVTDAPPDPSDLLFGIVVMWVVATGVFILYFVARTTSRDPRRPASHHADNRAIEHRLGLDRPLLAQYGSYLWRLPHGDLGYSYVNESVGTIIRQDSLSLRPSPSAAPCYGC
jgi:ABC-type dipeptide/oligopeptide/nickel transport system permease component